LIIINHKISSGTKKKLSRFGELMELQTQGITYSAISGHPDIFFCQSPGHLFAAPNLPEKYFKLLDDHKIRYITGELPVGGEYPATSRYNAVAMDKYLIHNFRHTDFTITRTLEDLTPVHVDQGYCRCNLLPLKDGHFITSDPGIHKVLQGLHPPAGGLHPCSLFVNSHKIKLEGFPHGFFGGCCGVLENTVFINGSLSHHPDSGQIKEYLVSLGYKIVELDEGPLTDVGGILFADR